MNPRTTYRDPLRPIASRLPLWRRGLAAFALRMPIAKTDNKRTPVFRLVLIAFAALLVHGYHLGVDDAEIYVPAIKKAADPGLYTFGSEFFMAHSHLSLFPSVVGASARLTHLPVDLVIFLWHFGGICLLLMASWRLLSLCFRNEGSRWGGIALLAGVLTVPVAGTALAIMDPYLTARSLSTPAMVFAVACYLAGNRRGSLLWLLAVALIHPQMSVYGAAFLVCLALARHRQTREHVAAASAVCASAMPFLFPFGQAHGPAREALFSRTYFFLSNWTWYEWLGVVAPLGIAWWLASKTPRNTMPMFRPVLRALVVVGALFTAAGLIVTFSPQLENFTRLQPMRAFHLIYVIFFLVLGGLIGEYLLRHDIRRWLGLFVPLAVSMWCVQQDTYASSSHVEWPGVADRNRWNTAFIWIRNHTPKNAVFALDPDYMLRPGEDSQGFRALAERSALAENIKDSGAVSLFPELAVEWKAEVTAQHGWQQFRPEDFQNLAKEYPVTWIVADHPPLHAICPYMSGGLVVCRISTVEVATSN
jgi:hypothetical protein